MELYLSADQSIDPARQTHFGTLPVEIKTIDDLRKVVANQNHTAAQFREGRRQSSNWEGSDVIVLDVDEGCTVEEFRNKFKEYAYYITTSKSHGLPKKERPGCDRFHVYFPLSRVYLAPADTNSYHKLMVDLVGKHTFFDKGAKDLARFFFKSGGNVVCYENSGKFIDKGFIGAEEKEVNTKPTSEVTNSPRKESSKLIALLNQCAQNGVFDVYSEWIKVGAGLKKEGFGVDDWIALSWNSAGEECRSKWSTLPSNQIKMGT